jgi:MFS family permease
MSRRDIVAEGAGEADARATFGSVFAVTEFRALWLAQVLSVVGDQLARVAVTLLVYDRTHSALLAAVTFAASVVPTFVGGVFLAGLADRLPRRLVMITCDLARMALVAGMALPGIPLALLVILLFAVTMLGTPFTSARAASFTDILPGDQFVVGTAIALTTYQVAQVAGFAAGGAIAGFFGVRTSLVADAATFAASAIITRIWMRARPAARPAEDRHSAERNTPSVTGILAGVRLVFTNPALRTPMLLGWLAAFYNAPEGVAAPLARELGRGAAAVGLILASGALGAAVGAVAFSRLVSPPTRLRWMRPLAFLSCAVLILFVLHPPFPLALLILFVSGAFDCFQVAASAAFLSAAPGRQRSQVFGLAQAGMSLGQGAALILAGALAQHHSPSTAIAVIGMFGAIAAVVVAAGQPPWRAPGSPAGHPSKWPTISRRRPG